MFYSPHSVAGTWCQAKDGSVLITCPDGHAITIITSRISKDGRIMPSVECKHQGCDFHDYVRLVDWETRGDIKTYNILGWGAAYD